MTDEDVVHTCVSTRPIAWLRHVKYRLRYVSYTSHANYRIPTAVGDHGTEG